MNPEADPLHGSPRRRPDDPPPAAADSGPLDPLADPANSRLFASMLNGIAHCRLLWEGDQPRDWVYLRVNPAFERQTGVRDPVGRRVSEVVPGLLEQDPEWLRIYGEVVRTGRPARFERQVGSLALWFDIAAYPAARDEFVAVCEDVTERRRAEQALVESEARYRTLYETVPRGIVFQDAGGAILSANPEAERILGLSLAQLQGRSPVDPSWRAIHEDGSPFPGDAHPSSVALATGQPCGPVVMGVFNPARAATCWISVQAVPLFRAGEARPFQVYATFDDLTERRNTSELKRVQEDQYRLLREQETILEGANVGISMVVDRRQVWVNRWMEQVFQYSREEMVGRTTRMFYPSQAAYDRFGAEAYPPMARNEPYETVMELLRKDGRSVWIHYNGRAVDPLDPGRGTLWVLTDVTAARLVEEELRRSEARFRAMFETHNSVMLLVDPAEDRIVDANPAAARFYGYSQETLREMPISGINALPPDALKEALAQAETMSRNAFVFPHRLASGELRTVEVNSSPMEVQGRRLLFSIIMDVTARVAYEQELRVRQDQLTELNRTLEQKVLAAVVELRRRDQLLIIQGRQAAMGEMIGHIAHQWRQPLGSLSMLLANLRDAYRYQDLDLARMEEAFAKGDLLIQKMSSTIGDFRNFFNPDKEKAPFSALRQIRRAVALVDASFEAGQVRIQVDAPADVRMLGFPNEFSQVLLNLLGNARQAIREAGPAAGLVSLHLDAIDGFGRVRVRDNGTGIPEAFLDRIFDPYFSTRATGTGIGLHMSRQIIEDSMGGRILARNLDQGAELEVRVPLAGS